VPFLRCGTGSGSLSVGRAGLPASTDRPNVMSWDWPRMTRCCEWRFGRSRVVDRGGVTVAPISICTSRAGRSAASAPSGCGSRKGYGCLPSAANASDVGIPRCQAIMARRPLGLEVSEDVLGSERGR
jgi:hypothetical protein